MNRSAYGLASLGRNGDTMLVHMNPTEVASLQRIAQVGGTSMTVNPRTGLPEAFNLKALLPMVAGGLSMLIPGMQPLGAGLIGGATGLATGDKELSPLARFGIGALGGFGTAGAVQGLTAAAGGAAGAGAGSSLGLQGGASTLGANAAVTPTLSNIGTGFSNVLGGGAGGTAARTAFSAAMPFGKLGLAAATAPAVAEAAKTPTFDIPEEKFKYYTTSYNPGEVNENFGQPGQNYFTGQGYGEMVEHEIDPNNPSEYSYGAAAGGRVDDFHISPVSFGMAEGGEVPPMSSQRNAVETYINSLNSKLTAPPMITPRPAPSTPTNPNAPNYMNNMGVKYDPTTQSFSGSGSGMGKFLNMGPFGSISLDDLSGMRGMPMAQRASGGLTSLGGYSQGGYAGGRLLKGPGDGVSDDIPAVIDHGDGEEQPARLARGEYVLDAQTVAKLGNGSTEAGAEAIDEMVKRIHAIPTRPGKDLKARRHMPA